LSAQGIRYAVLGGVAVSLYGEPRMTADIDVNVILDKAEITTFLSRIKKYSFYPALENTETIARETGVIPLEFRRGKTRGMVDVIIAENILEYKAIRRGKIKRIGSMRVRFVSPEDLILHKITSSRPRDLEDLKGILARQKGKLNIGYIKSWLKKIDRVDGKRRLRGLFENLLRDR
jgi:hypothetical protein